MRSLAPLLLAACILVGCASNPRWKRQVFAFSLPADPPTTNAQTNIVALSRVSISPLFQNRSFTYRTAENTYELDPYAGFLVLPERTLAGRFALGCAQAGSSGVSWNRAVA